VVRFFAIDSESKERKGDSKKTMNVDVIVNWHQTNNCVCLDKNAAELRG
jgi:hypothetical protein